MIRSFLLVLCTLVLGENFAFASPVANVKNGTLEGTYMQSRRGRMFPAFRGIPYAIPPLGDLRFEPPKPAEAWTGVRSAKEDAGICVQRNIYTHEDAIYGVEDCLYLNVYTPKLPTTSNEDCRDNCRKNYPVMIWFHGGGWVTGAGHSEFYGPKFLLDHDVVLVTLNYRLGPLGFLSFEDLVLPGNMAMKDQAQAIRWVHENIAAFSGDPNRITLFGESAGGVAVHYHMISPLSRGLFHRGISQSGTALCPWALTKAEEAKEKAKRLGELLNCPTSSSKELLKCLRKKDPKDIIGTDRSFQVFDYDPMIPFRPVVEMDHPGAFLKELPAKSVEHGRIMDIPWMTGITAEEGAIRTAGIFGIPGLLDRFNEEYESVMPLSLLYEDTCPKSLRSKVTKKLRKFYLNNEPVDISKIKGITDMYSDSWFTFPAEHAARIHLDTMSSPLYFYYLTYRGSSSFSSMFGDSTRDYGVSHADDLQYLFPVGEQLFKNTPLTKTDHRMVDFLTNAWVNFAKSGNPTPEITKGNSVKWKPLHTDDFEYLNIGEPISISMSKNLVSERMQFWANLPCQKLQHRPKTEKVKDEL